MMVRELGRTIEALKNAGTSILLVEQQLAFALLYADVVFIMSKGRIVHQCSPAELQPMRKPRPSVFGVECISITRFRDVALNIEREIEVGPIIVRKCKFVPVGCHRDRRGAWPRPRDDFGLDTERRSRCGRGPAGERRGGARAVKSSCRRGT